MPSETDPATLAATLVADGDFAMGTGNGSVVDGEIALLAAANTVHARLELNFPCLRCTGIDQKAVHANGRQRMGQLISGRVRTVQQIVDRAVPRVTKFVAAKGFFTSAPASAR